MSENASPPKERPLSPHLLIYKPQMTSMLSIMHRATGVALMAGTLMVAWWLIAAATSENAYNIAQNFAESPLGTFMIFGWSVALFYHMSNGIRHLFWDMGYLFKIENAYKAGYFVLFLTVLLTGITWFAAYSQAETVTTEVEQQQEQSCKKLCESYSDTAKDFRGDRTCYELCVEEGACSLPHVACTEAPVLKESAE